MVIHYPTYLFHTQKVKRGIEREMQVAYLEMKHAYYSSILYSIFIAQYFQTYNKIKEKEKKLLPHNYVILKQTTLNLNKIINFTMK